MSIKKFKWVMFFLFLCFLAGELLAMLGRRGFSSSRKSQSWTETDEEKEQREARSKKVSDELDDFEAVFPERGAATPPPVRQAPSVTSPTPSSPSRLGSSAKGQCIAYGVMFHGEKYDVFGSVDEGYSAYKNGEFVVKRIIEYDAHNEQILRIIGTVPRDSEIQSSVARSFRQPPPLTDLRGKNPFRLPSDRDSEHFGYSPLEGISPKSTEAARAYLDQGVNRQVFKNDNASDEGSDRGLQVVFTDDVNTVPAHQKEQEAPKIPVAAPVPNKEMTFSDHLTEFKEFGIKYKKSFLALIGIPLILGLGMKIYISELNKDFPKTKKEHAVACLKKTKELVWQALKKPRESYKIYPKFTAAVWANLVADTVLFGNILPNWNG